MCATFGWIGFWFYVYARVRQNKNETKPTPKNTLTLFGDLDNNQPPDTEQLWENNSANRAHIACRLSPGDVCVKFSYIYNDAGKNFPPHRYIKIHHILVGACRTTCTIMTKSH